MKNFPYLLTNTVESLLLVVGEYVRFFSCQWPQIKCHLYLFYIGFSEGLSLCNPGLELISRRYMAEIQPIQCEHQTINE